MTNISNKKLVKQIFSVICFVMIVLMFSMFFIPANNIALAYTDNQIVDGFGYNGGTYYWNGAINMTVDDNSYKLEGGQHKFKPSTEVTFVVVTISKHNALNQISGTVRMAIDGTSSSHTCNVRVSIWGVVTLTNTIYTFNVPSTTGTYNMSIESNLTRNKWTDIDNVDFEFIVANW